MPMHRWMQSAAGGTSQRLKPAVAIVRSRSRKPAPAPDTPAVLLIVVILSLPAAAILGVSAVHDPASAHPAISFSIAASHHFPMRRDHYRIEEFNTCNGGICPASCFDP